MTDLPSDTKPTDRPEPPGPYPTGPFPSQSELEKLNPVRPPARAQPPAEGFGPGAVTFTEWEGRTDPFRQILAALERIEGLLVGMGSQNERIAPPHA